MGTIRDEFEKLIKNPHDATFKSAFQKKEVAISFFRGYLPKKIIDRLDLECLDIRDRSYVDEKLRDTHSDIVYQTKIDNSDAFLYLLFEHQSSPDRFFAFRLLCYMVALWKEYIDQNPKARMLPVVIPLTLYHGTGKWNSPDRLWKLLEGGEDFREYIPDFSYELYNLADYDDDSLLVGDFMALGVVLYLMKHIFDKDFGDIFIRAVEYLMKIRDKRTQLEFLELVLRYTYHARNDEESVVKDYIERGVGLINEEIARRLAMTVAEQIREKGKEEGKKEGKQELLLAILKRRFGPMPPELERKVLDADIDSIEKVGEAFLDFKDLRDLETWWAAHRK